MHNFPQKTIHEGMAHCSKCAIPFIPNTKLQIYKGIIQFILDSTKYTLKNIAELSNSSLDGIRMIYCHNQMPSHFQSEVQLLKLYQIVLEIIGEQKSSSMAG